jgi:endonuclease-3
MSSQTKDEITFSTLKSLVLDHNLSVDVVIATPEATLNEWISKVGFHNQKAKHIKQTTQILKEKYEGKVPDKFEDLIGLPGVGPKMAHLVLQEAFDKVEGISVDTHVHRISNRLKWVKSSTPLETAA